MIMPMKPPPLPIRNHLPNKPHSSIQTSILNTFSNTAGHSAGYADNNKFGEISRRPSIIGNAPVHVDKSIPATFDLMSAFPVSFYFISLMKVKEES